MLYLSVCPSPTRTFIPNTNLLPLPFPAGATGSWTPKETLQGGQGHHRGRTLQPVLQTGWLCSRFWSLVSITPHQHMGWDAPHKQEGGCGHGNWDDPGHRHARVEAGDRAGSQVSLLLLHPALATPRPTVPTHHVRPKDKKAGSGWPLTPSQGKRGRFRCSSHAY